MPLKECDRADRPLHEVHRPPGSLVGENAGQLDDGGWGALDVQALIDAVDLASGPAPEITTTWSVVANRSGSEKKSIPAAPASSFQTGSNPRQAGEVVAPTRDVEPPDQLRYLRQPLAGSAVNVCHTTSSAMMPQSGG